MSKSKNHIHSFEDLQLTIKELKNEIKIQEETFKESPVIKIASTLSGKKSIKSLISSDITSRNMMSDSKLINTLLLSNKFTRKYFVGYTIAKEMIPYTFQKIAGLIKSKNDVDDSKLLE